MAEPWKQGHGVGNQGFDWGNLLRGAGSFLGSQGGIGALAGLGAAAGLRFAPSAMDLSRQRMQFIMKQLQGIPGLAKMFTSQLVQGSGGEQANILASGQAFNQSLAQRQNQSGVNMMSGVGRLSGALGDSLTGMRMADMYGRFNQQGFGMANQNIMQAIMAALTNDDMRNRVLGGVIDAGGRLVDRTLYPQQRA